jgi:transcriptional regulator with XRE-family HTH domain
MLRLIREDLGLSRFTAHDRHGISASYLFEIETDRYIPKLEALEMIIAGYTVDSLLGRHVRELRAPPEDLAPVDKLRQAVTDNVDWISHLDDLERRDVLAAYVDPIWDILACNDLFRSALPGIEKTDSIPIWIFSPIAQTVFSTGTARPLTRSPTTRRSSAFTATPNKPATSSGSSGPTRSAIACGQRALP